MFACCVLAVSLLGAEFEHGIYDAVSLDGEWEMAYRPYAHEVVNYPEFTGVKVANAIPGYWEDMVPAFRSAGMKDEFRVNPLYERQRFPISGWADDTTLPNIYGCFYYRRTVELDLRRAGDRPPRHAVLRTGHVGGYGALDRGGVLGGGQHRHHGRGRLPRRGPGRGPLQPAVPGSGPGY